ncbi:MAG: glycosyltransferase family 2 protein [Acidimicrobiales bacterium]
MIAPPDVAIAVLIPCRDEEVTVVDVVKGFRDVLPQATVYVCDNGSSDATATMAAGAGAVVVSEPRPGKGRAVKRLFADIDADVYILVDGDATYDASIASELVRHITHGGADLVNASRRPETGAWPRGHRFGNRVLTAMVARLFGRGLEDMLSGYKAMSHRMVKSFPVLSDGFEIETELAVHALSLSMPVAEIPSPYASRPAGSASKLHATRDGWRIGRTIFNLLRSERPLAFFASIAGVLAIISLAIAYPIFIHFLHTHLVPRYPSALLATGIMVVAFLSLTCGLVLDTVTRGRREAKLLSYLRLPGPLRHQD